ncbi:MAG: AAA family ATPase [Bryobacteraceae bacterium]
MIRIVTMEREYGAGGSAIARKLAAHLNWKVWDQALTAEIARMARCDQNSVARLEERVDPLFYRLMKVFMRGSYERSLPVPGLENLDADSMVVFMQRVIESAAAAGNCVIVGRGAPYLLRGRPDAFHVFVYAPVEEKIRRVRELGKSESEAVELVEAIDQERATFVKKYFGKEWPSRHLYHLMINSAVGDDAVVRTILSEMETLNGRVNGESPQSS